MTPFQFLTKIRYVERKHTFTQDTGHITTARVV